ncbi:hypothetical protein TVAG_455320 [Trichomonas vaginalis G3]|uniref:receptor protein-tyrosine kinase n=1 Tax=Trichomonas vaginalis (strain ATCC PRA-98 / G3) TaxID=412133 RepID=A2GAU9_TRIV3|nr:hypothetical protein TVAG_455320 [Trichomonas vaginalis G3]|eukprot:XP_001298653.1 hypothetical protein [Trichomonas vaginalis G3]
MCAGSGGGALSNYYRQVTQSQNFYCFGSPGGEASYNIGFPYTFAGSQISGELGIGGRGAESMIPRGNAIGGGGWSQLPDDRYQDDAIEHGGPGGSSYVSGHPDCISPDGGSVHPSHIVFENPVMIAGDKLMPSPSGGSMKGNSGPGVARITYLHDIETIELDYNHEMYSDIMLFYYLFGLS